ASRSRRRGVRPGSSDAMTTPTSSRSSGRSSSSPALPKRERSMGRGRPMRRGSGRHRATLPRGRRVRRRATLAVVVVGSAFGVGALQAVMRAPAAQPRPQPSPSSIVAAPIAPSPPPQGVPFARAKGVTLYLPAPDPRLIGYHEASYPDAATLAPIGRLQKNANRTKFRPPKDEKGPRYTVMSSRGRPTPATSAVDVVVPPSTRV